MTKLHWPIYRALAALFARVVATPTTTRYDCRGWALVRIHAADRDRTLKNHHRPATALVLRGSFLEALREGTDPRVRYKRRSKGATVALGPSIFRRIVMVEPGTWVLLR